MGGTCQGLFSFFHLRGTCLTAGNKRLYQVKKQIYRKLGCLSEKKITPWRRISRARGRRKWGVTTSTWGWQDGSLDKGACCQTWWPQFGLWDQHSDRWNRVPASSFLTATNVLWREHVLRATHTHTWGLSKESSTEKKTETKREHVSGKGNFICLKWSH